MAEFLISTDDAHRFPVEERTQLAAEVADASTEIGASLSAILGSQLATGGTPLRVQSEGFIAPERSRLTMLGTLVPMWDVVSAYTTSGIGGGSLTRETSDTVENPFMRLTTAAGVAANIYNTQWQHMPKGGGIAIRIRRDANLSSLRILVRVGAFGSSSKLYSADKGVSTIDTGVWYDLVIGMEDLAQNSAGSPVPADAESLKQIEIRATPLAGTVTVLDFARPRIVRGDGIPRVLWSFDDGRADTYTVAYPILKAAGYHGTIAVEYTGVGAADRCSLAQLQEMYADGWEYIGHHTAQITSLTDAAAELVFQASQDWAITNSFWRGISHWVWPGGARDATKDAIAARHYRTRRRTSPMSTSTVPYCYDPSDVSFHYMLTTTSLATAKSMVDRAVAFGTTLIFGFHSIVTTPSAPEDWNIQDFTDLVAYAQSLGMVGTSYDATFGRN